MKQKTSKQDIEEIKKYIKLKMTTNIPEEEVQMLDALLAKLNGDKNVNIINENGDVL